jgi:hypothetical protein
MTLQLDSTRIAVRERSLLDTFDLSLHVSRHYIGRLLLTFFAVALCLMVVNHLLLGWIIDTGNQGSFFYADDLGMISRFVWDMSILVAIEAPLGSVFATAYLGQAMFVDRPQLGQIALDVLKLAPRIAWCQLLVRGVLPVWLLLLALDRFSDFDPTIEALGLGALACYVLGLRFWRPFINEIVLLERTPLIARGKEALTVRRRSRQLHAPSSGNLFLRGLAASILAVCLTLACFGTFVFISGIFLNDWRPGPFMIGIVLPLSMWIVTGYLSVVRFLNYLDLRIRHEGWEVELRLRAEGERLASRLVK